MPIKLKGVTTYGRTDEQKFNACELVPNFGTWTGRKQRTDEQIDAMVASLLLYGQESDFIYRKGFDGEPIPVTGHTRILAAARITERKMKGPNGVQYGPKNPFILVGRFRQMNEAEAMFHMFAENDEATRTPLNDVDIALFIRTVSETQGLTDTAIAERLNKPNSWVSLHRKVLDLDTETQDKIVSGELKFNTAVGTVANIEPAKRAAVIKKAKKDTGKTTATAPAVRKAAVDLGVKTSKPLSRSDKQFKDWVKATIEITPVGPAQVFLYAVLDYRAGLISQEALDMAFMPLVEMEVSATAGV